MPIDKTTLQK